LERADGRPLYAYRATDAELDSIRSTFEAELLPRVSTGRIDPAVAQGFCLWAAEWWRCHHEGGPWRWAELLRAAGCTELDTGRPGYSYLCGLVASGVVSWGRKLLRVGHAREFLLTLACEGGLPLRMVRREEGSLRRYLRALLEEIRIFGTSGAAAIELAERAAGHLPRSLRNEVVYRLAGDLAHALWNLQVRVGDTRNPSRDLDEVAPGWRERLPLRLDDATAALLIDHLLQDAVRIARNPHQEVRWTRHLDRRGDVWKLVGELSLPSVLYVETAVELFGIGGSEAAPPRFDLLMLPDSGRPALLALATSRLTRAGETVYGLEHTGTAGARATDADAAGARSLLACDGAREFSGRAFAGAGAMEAELPWIFVPAAESHRPAFAGQGSMSVRAPFAWVSVPDGCTPSEVPGEACTPAGIMEAPLRAVFRVTGSVTFADPLGNRFRVRTAVSTAEETNEYWLDGDCTEVGRTPARVFVGVPRLRIRNAHGQSRTVPTHELAWVPEGVPARGQPTGPWVGSGRLRHVVGGEVRFSVGVQILPQGSSIRFLPAAEAREGAIEFAGCGAPELAVLAPGTTEWQAAGGEPLRLVLRSPAEPPACVDVVLAWPGRGRMSLSLPFPSVGGGFSRPDGQRLESGAVVALGRVAGIRAAAMVPHADTTFYVEGTVRGEHAAHLSAGQRTFRAEMVELQRGRFELDLGRLYLDMAQRLANGGADAEVRLRVQSNQAGDVQSRTITVRQFDLQLEHDAPSASLRIAPDLLRTLAPEEVSALRVRAVPRYSPDGPETPLPRAGAGAWALPDRFEGDSPWLLLAEHGDWVRVAPFTWPPGEPDDGTDPEALAASADAPEWKRVDSLIQWSATIPAGVFSALRTVAHAPEAAALAAVRAGSAAASTWRALEVCGCEWLEIPQSAWERAVDAYWTSLQSASDDLTAALGAPDAHRMLESELDRHIGPVCERLPWLAPVFGFARSRLLGVRVPRETSALVDDVARKILSQRRDAAVRACPAFEVHPRELREIPDFMRLQEELNARVMSRDLWVSGARYSHPERAGFANAPVLAALVAVTGYPLPVETRRAIRDVRDVRPRWFSDLYEQTFLLAVGAIEREKSNRLAQS
jgi:hypothetical protein